VKSKLGTKMDYFLCKFYLMLFILMIMFSETMILLMISNFLREMRNYKLLTLFGVAVVDYFVLMRWAVCRFVIIKYDVLISTTHREPCRKNQQGSNICFFATIYCLKKRSMWWCLCKFFVWAGNSFSQVYVKLGCTAHWHEQEQTLSKLRQFWP
jgi:hypothetical protein